MRTIEKSIRSVESVKAEISERVGDNICVVETNRQGKQINKYSGTITSVHDRLFLMRVEGSSYSYNKAISFAELVTREYSYSLGANVNDLVSHELIT